MLRKKMIRKIIITSSALFALLLIYLIPNQDEKLNINQNLEYVNLEVATNTIYYFINFPSILFIY